MGKRPFLEPELRLRTLSPPPPPLGRGDQGRGGVDPSFTVLKASPRPLHCGRRTRSPATARRSAGPPAGELHRVLRALAFREPPTKSPRPAWVGDGSQEVGGGGHERQTNRPDMHTLGARDVLRAWPTLRGGGVGVGRPTPPPPQWGRVVLKSLKRTKGARRICCPSYAFGFGWAVGG